MKKFLSLLLLICLTLSLFAGCAQKPQEPADPKDPVVDPTEPTDPTEPAEPTEPDVPEEPSEPDPDAEYELTEKASFLRFKPVVTVRDGEYEIWITSLNPGTVRLVIGGKVYRAEDEREDDWNFFKFRVPQQQLNTVKTYAVCYLAEGEEKAIGFEYEFKPIEKTEGINVYVTSDVHGDYKAAQLELAYFGDDLDLIVGNGDIINGISTPDEAFKVISFYGELCQGRYPLVTARGNHEYYGEGADGYEWYIAENGKNYYEFSIGPINGIVLNPLDGYVRDVEQTDPDILAAEAESLRLGQEAETEFLNNLTLDNDKINMVITHVCPIYSDEFPSDEFTKWAERLNELKVDFMVCGHFHENFIFEPNDERSEQPHDYPIVFGCTRKVTATHSGIAFTLYNDKAEVVYVDSKLGIMDTATVSYPQN